MKRIKFLLLALVLCGLLAGCSLAKPEAEGAAQDRFAGFYVVRDASFKRRSDFWSSDNPLLEEYGSKTLDTGKYGTVQFPDLVLFGQEKDNQWTFPGLEDGFSIFILHRQEEWGPVSEMVGTMAPGEEGMTVNSTDEGDYETASGIVYYGPPLGVEDWDKYNDSMMWHTYRVYETPEGVPYLNGEGNSFQGGFSGYTETHTYATTINGERSENTVKISVSAKAVPRLEKLVVTQFSAENTILRADDLAIREDLPEVRCEADTAWVLVEEISAEGTVRTVYNIPAEDGENVSHMVVLLDDEGLGRLAYLDITWD